MEIEGTDIPGFKIIHLDKFSDNRGSFLKVFNIDFFEKHGLETNYKESYFSISHKNVIRGMHFQIPPYEHTKLVFINQGEIMDVVLDLRIKSPTFGRFLTIELNTSNPVILYLPPGCAHGFLSLEDNSMVSYLQTTVYNPLCDKGIKFDSFGMNWGITNPIVSKRDNEFICLDLFKSPF